MEEEPRGLATVAGAWGHGIDRRPAAAGKWRRRMEEGKNGLPAHILSTATESKAQMTLIR